MRESREAILEGISMENAKFHGNLWNLVEIQIRKCFINAILYEHLRYRTKFQDFPRFPLEFQ